MTTDKQKTATDESDDSVQLGDDKIELTSRRGLRWKLLSTYFSVMYATSFIGLIGAHVTGMIDLGSLPRQFRELYLAITAGVAVFVIGAETIQSYLNHKHE